jgi:CheY-like chemotaxis protein
MLRVLVADDDKYLNKLVSDRLSLEEDVEVVSCLDGENALKTLQEYSSLDKPFDLLLCDMLLPKMMGAEVFTRIREDEEKFKNLRIIAISGIYKDEQQIKELTALHQLEAYWTKPFDLDHLVASIIKKEAAPTTWKASLSSGFLKETSIERLFFEAYGRGFTGKLLIKNERSERRIYFANGFPVAAESTSLNESLGHSLVRLKLISEETRQKVSEEMVQKGLQFGQALVELNILSSAQLFDALRRHTYRVLLATYQWKEGSFEFESLDALPTYIMVLEFNSFLLTLKYHQATYPEDFLRSLYETKGDSYPHRTDRFAQVLPLLNLEQASMEFISRLSGQENLRSILSKVPPAAHEIILRVFYLFESLGLLSWKSEPSQTLEEAPRDLHHSLGSTPTDVDTAKKIQSIYVELLNQDFFEVLKVSHDAQPQDLDAAYREMRFQLHPDRFGGKLDGQTQRILDDILARIDQAYQTLSHEQSRKEYSATVHRLRADSVADSKRFLEAQDFDAAWEKFTHAHQLWTRGFEYEAYALYAAFRQKMKAGTAHEAQHFVMKLKDLGQFQSDSEIPPLLLAHCLLQSGKKEQAREAYQKALQLNEHCDEAAHALANLGDQQLKRDRVQKAVRKTKRGLIVSLSLGSLFILAGFIYSQRDLLVPKEEGIDILNPADFTSIVPAREGRIKQGVIKMKVQRGWAKTVPDSVMKSKCLQLIESPAARGAKRIYLYDEDKGLKVYCYENTIRIYKD